MLLRYVRDVNNNPYGCVIALRKDLFTYSLCARGDKFSKNEAKRIAMKRLSNRMGSMEETNSIKFDAQYCIDEINGNAMCYQQTTAHIGNCDFGYLIDVIKDMDERAVKYFKE